MIITALAGETIDALVFRVFGETARVSEVIAANPQTLNSYFLREHQKITILPAPAPHLKTSALW